MKNTQRPEQPAAYYDKVYKKADQYKLDWTKSRYIKLWEKIVENLGDNKNQKIIDAGCGTGQLLAMLNHHGFKHAIGFDYSQTAIEIAQQIFPQIKCAHGDIFKVDFKGFDTVITTEVMEHIQNDEEVLRRIVESGVKTVILSVPTFDDKAHVRYFEGTYDVGHRYGKYFKSYIVEKIGPWLLLVGRN